MEKIRHLFVNYDFISGEYETCSCTIIPAENGESDEDAVHRYFSTFWGEENTETVEKARLYHGWGAVVAVKITGWKEIPPKDLKTLEKYVWL